MNPDNSLETMFQVMKDGEWVELPSFPKLPIFSVTKLNQYQRNLLRLRDLDIPNNYLKLHGIKMRRRK